MLVLPNNVTLDLEMLMKAETRVTYTQDQWDAIQYIRMLLLNPEPGVQPNSLNSDSSDSSDSGDSSDSSNPQSQGQDQDPDSGVTNALMRLCMLVVMQDTSRIKLYESPIMHYLAVRGVDEKSKTLRAPFFYTGILGDSYNLMRLVSCMTTNMQDTSRIK